MTADMFDHTKQPLARVPLDAAERAAFIQVMEPLVRWLGSPGDWGYGTKLGDLAIRCGTLLREVKS